MAVKTGGAVSRSVSGGEQNQGQLLFDPDDWLESAFRSVEAYVKYGIDQDIYTIQFSFPSAADLGQFMPLQKTLLSFELDDIENVPIGFGDNVFNSTTDDFDGTIVEEEGQCHILHFDVGIWASDTSGGVTARLRAYSHLNNIFHGPSAFKSCQRLTGMEIQAFNHGNFIKEEIDEISMFRVSGIALDIRVYSRKILVPAPFIAGFDQDPSLITTEDEIIYG